jgi:hypothetical protein
MKEANRVIYGALGDLKKPNLTPEQQVQALGVLNSARTDRNRIAKKYGFDQSPTAPVQAQSEPTVPQSQPVATAAPQPQATIPYKEGTRVRNKITGKMFRIVNGQPVPE